MTIRALEFYSGIGGLHRAFIQSNVQGQVVHAFDWDQSACRVYDANYGEGIVQKVDISTLRASDLSPWNANLWLLSPSCQPYTVLNPLAKGAADPRATSFIHLMEDVLPELAESDRQPRYILVENVAGFETSSTRTRLLATLDALNYSTLELLLTPLQFGIPNSRLRYYLLAKLKPLSFAHTHTHAHAHAHGTDVNGNDTAVWRCIPGGGDAWVDPRMRSLGGLSGDEARGSDEGAFVEGGVGPEVDEIRRYLDVAEEEEVHARPGSNAYLHPHAVPDGVLVKWGRLFDIVLPSARRSCCFTRGYTKMVERTGSIVQMNEHLDTTSTFDTFLDAAKHTDTDTDIDTIEILRPLRLRYFSPTELLRLFGFLPLPPSPSSSSNSDSDSRAHSAHSKFDWPETISTKTQYKLIGNSINVRVVAALITYLFTAQPP